MSGQLIKQTSIIYILLGLSLIIFWHQAAENLPEVTKTTPETIAATKNQGKIAERAVSETKEVSRIVSLNICTDQLLLLLAERNRIASVTFLAANPETSMMAGEVKDLVLNHGLAEEVIKLKPDLIVAGLYSARASVNLLEKLGYPILRLESARNFDDIRNNLRVMGQAIQRDERAEFLIAEMDVILNAKFDNRTNNLSKVVTNYDVNGYVTGKDTLFSAVAHAAGYQTLGDLLDFSGYRQVPLEQLLVLKPDLIDPGFEWKDPPALASESLRHPAFRKLLSQVETVDLPGAAWTCGLPQLSQLVRQLRQLHTAGL